MEIHFSDYRLNVILTAEAALILWHCDVEYRVLTGRWMSNDLGSVPSEEFQRETFLKGYLLEEKFAKVYLVREYIST